MRLRRAEEVPSADGALVVFDPGGVLVTGNEHAVAQTVEQLKAIGQGGRSAFSGNLADLVAAGSTIKDLVAQHGEYLRLTDRSLALLREHGPSGSGTGVGTIWGFVRDKKGFAGNLDFSRVPIGPEQALALQTAGATLALRAAIHQIEVALERVESKIDELRDMLHAEQIGDVLGTRAMLRPLVERIRDEGQLSETDWSAVDSIGKDAARDVEKLRAHLRTQLRKVKQGWRTGQRADTAADLIETDGLLRETLALLALAEENVGLWQQIRIFHVQLAEPEHLAYTISDAQTFLRDSTREDQLLLGELRSVAAAVTEPRPLDGLAPWQHRELAAARTDLQDLCDWFADQRSLDLTPLDAADFPSWKDSVKVVGRATKYIVRQSASVAADTTRRLRPGRAQEVTDAEHPTPELEE